MIRKGQSITPASCRNTGAFAREVRTRAYTLEGVEASVVRKTDFPCKDFRVIIHSLAAASTTVKERIGAMEHGKFKIVGFIEPNDSDSNGWCSPLPNEVKREGRRR